MHNDNGNMTMLGSLITQEMDDKEYADMKKDTLAQLKEFQATLAKMTSGNMTLVNELGQMQLAIQAAVSQAFKTPEVIRLFAARRPQELRQRLSNLQRDVRLQKLTQQAYIQQAVEILSALKQLKDPLSPQEEALLQEHGGASLAAFEAVAAQSASGAGGGTISVAAVKKSMK